VNFNLGHINTIASVSVIIDDSGYVFNVILFKKKKEKLKIVKRQEKVNSINELLKITGKYCSFILHFTGKGVLNKKIENRPNYRSKIFMNVNLEDFHFTDVETQSYIFSSVIRKNVVDDIIGEFNTKLNHVISISSGPFISQVIKNKIIPNSVIVNKSSLEFDKNILVDFSKETKEIAKEYALEGNQQVNNLELATFAHADLFFFPKENYILPEDEKFSEGKQETEQKNIFIRFGASMLVFFLVVLIGNMVYLDNLNEDININHQELSVSEQTLQEVVKLTDEKNRKEKMLKSSGLLNRQFLSFYLKELSNSTPNNISFTNVSIRPLLNEIKNNYKIEIEENTIYIIGETISSNLLSEWIKKIERKNWINKIDILNYYYSKGRGEFELKIEIINV